MTKQVSQIPVYSISADPDQPRKEFKAEAVEELARSIRQSGLLQPIAVRPMEDSTYRIIAGERRYRAVCSLEWDTIDAIVYDVPEREAKELQLLENIVRQDLNGVETALAYQSFLGRGYSPEEVGQIVGKPKNIISWTLNVLRCTESIRSLIAKGQLSMHHGVALSKLTAEGQARVMRLMTLRPMTINEVYGVCDKVWAEENAVEMFPETKLSAEAVQARGAIHSAIDKAAQAVGDWLKMEEKNPGITRTAMESDGLAAEEQLEQLIRGLRRIKNVISAAKMEALV